MGKLHLRLTSALLALCMIVSMVPMHVFASEMQEPATSVTEPVAVTEPVVVEEIPVETEIAEVVGEDAEVLLAANDVLATAFVFSDLHMTQNTTATNNQKLTTLSNTLKQLGSVSSVTSAGDMFSVNETSFNCSTTNITSTINAAAPGAAVNYVWSDHDRTATEISKESRLVYTGEYYIYLLSMADTSTNDRYNAGLYSSAEVDAHVEAFKTTVAGLDHSKPLFIVAHQPLLDRRDDNGHAYKWAVAINEVAEDMDVAYFFGHNHKYDVETDYYTAKGSTVAVCSDSNGNATNVTLNFTHMCAGYMAPSSTGSTSGTTRQGVALGITVYEDSINYATYDANGKYTGDYALDVTVARTKNVDSGDQGGSGDLGGTAEPGTLNQYVAVNGSTGADDVTPSTEGWVEVVAPIIGDAGADDVTPSTEGWVEYVKPVPETLGGTYYEYAQDIDGVNTNTGYLIVNSNSTEALDNNGSDSVKTITDFTIDTEPNPDVAKTQTQDYEWKIDGNNRIHTSINGTSYYLRIAWGSSALSFTNNPDSGWNGATQWNITNNNGQYTVSTSVRSYNGNTTYYLTSSGVTTTKTTVRLFGPATAKTEQGEAGQNGIYYKLDGSTTCNVANGTSADAALAAVRNGLSVLMHEGMDTNDAIGTEVEGAELTLEWADTYAPTMAGDYAVKVSYTADGKTHDLGTVEVVVAAGESTPGTWHKLSGDLSYNVAAGTSADDALAAVKAGLDGYKFIDLSAPVADDKGTKLNDAELTWVLADDYSGNVAGDYAVNIYKGENLLGTAEVIVPASTTYYIAEGLDVITVNSGTSAGDALAAVKAGITVSSATSAEGNNKQIIADSQVTWNWVDQYNGNFAGPYTVEILYNGLLLGTVEVAVDVDYSADISEPLTGSAILSETVTTSNRTVYVLVDRPENGQKYLITNQTLTNGDLSVDWSEDDDGMAVVRNGTSITYEYIYPQSGTITDVNGNQYTKGYIENDNENAVWTATANNTNWRFSNGNQYLRVDGDSTVAAGNAYNWTYNANGDDSRLYNGSKYLYFTYSGNGKDQWKWQTGNATGQSSTRDIFFYKQVTIPGGTETINRVYTVAAQEVTKNIVAGTNTAMLEYSLLCDENELDSLPAGGSWSFVPAADSHGIIQSIDQETGMITFTNVSGHCKVKVSYTWTVGDEEHTAYRYVDVTAKTPNDNPEYPDEGAVKVNKTGSGIAFQTTGVATIELSASGIPLKKGADLIIMLDTSSSMRNNNITASDGTSKTRAAVLEDALKQLIAQLKTPGEDGQVLDIRVAIADFNGYYGDGSGGTTGTPYDRTSGDYVRADNGTGSGYSQASQARVYTGSQSLGLGAFVQAENLATSYTLNYTSGTNYDYAFDAIYQLGAALRVDNEEKQVERDLFVVFMSDGAALQWNYFGSQNGYDKWNSWITGAWDADDLTTANINSTTHSYFYDLKDHDGDGQLNEHRMANAIKGGKGETFEIIRKSTAGLPEGTLTPVNGKQYLYTVYGLGATMFAINFDAKKDGDITVESIDKALASTASPQTDTTQYYYKVTSADQLKEAFKAIGNEVAYAATNARFEDQVMGSHFDLMTKEVDYKDRYGQTQTITPMIEVRTYEIYTRQDYETGKVSLDQVGVRTGNFTTQEVVLFSNDGTKAYSTLIDVDKDGKFGVKNNDGTYSIDDTDDNIIGEDGVIYALSLMYNTTNSSIYFDLDHDSEGVKEYELKPESFYWKLGTIATMELALRYFVRLEGADGGVPPEAGTYPTNDHAILYYDNYLGNPVKLETISPLMPWKAANISFAFYLVNDDGEIIVNQTTGQTGSFANKIAVTAPVVYKEIALTDRLDVETVNIKSKEVFPEGYSLYDENAEYMISFDENSDGSWVITSGKDVHSTYVTNYDPDKPSAFTNMLTATGTSGAGKEYDYTHTTVWFAVKYEVKTIPDTVVIDYGLPVDIDVIYNDMFGENGSLKAVGPVSSIPSGELFTEKLTEGFGTSCAGNYGEASVTTNGKLRYQLSTSNGMHMAQAEKFGYAAYYTSRTVNNSSGYYYGTVTVIPATTIYYEENFVTFTDSTQKTGNMGEWTAVGEVIGDAVQSEDRPGFGNLSNIDANNVYGFDPAYKNFTTYSLGGAKKITVDATTAGKVNEAGYVQFSFTGTGFDVISLTDSDSGTIIVQVFNQSGSRVKNLIVDNYYGYQAVLKNVTYTYDGEGWNRLVGENATQTEQDLPGFPETPKVDDEVTAVEYVWEVSPNGDTIWQVPVMKVDGLSYGTYTVKILPMYAAAYDHADDGSYSFWMDAIRIYNPALADGESNEAHGDDLELIPTFITLRDLLVDAGSMGSFANSNDTITGIVFIDGRDGTTSIDDYANPGPNNETYLANGQGVSFRIQSFVKPDKVQLGIKLAYGSSAALRIGDTEFKTITTATDMFYDITDRLTWSSDLDEDNRLVYRSSVIVLSNTSANGVLSLTELKLSNGSYGISTSAMNAEGTQAISLFVDREVLTEAPALMKQMYYVAPEPVEPETPEEPETTEPEPTEPEVTPAVPGDMDGDGMVTVDDVLALLWYVLFPDDYPIDADADFDGNAQTNVDDVLTLLWYVLFPDDYPLPEKM